MSIGGPHEVLPPHGVRSQALGGAAADYLDRVSAEMGLPLATDAEPE